MKHLPLLLLTALIALAFKNSLQKFEPEAEAESIYDETWGMKEAEAEAEPESYSQYQIAMWYLKAHESFRPYEYPDGEYPSKGFGLNLSPDHVTWATAVLGFDCRSRDWTWREGEKLLQAFWGKKRARFVKKHPNMLSHQQTAILLHAYNTGKYTNVRGCCGAQKGCGRDNAKIRKAHTERRNFEWKLYQGKVTDDDIAAIRRKAIAVEKKWKNF